MSVQVVVPLGEKPSTATIVELQGMLVVPPQEDQEDLDVVVDCGTLKVDHKKVFLTLGTLQLTGDVVEVKRPTFLWRRVSYTPEEDVAAVAVPQNSASRKRERSPLAVTLLLTMEEYLAAEEKEVVEKKAKKVSYVSDTVVSQRMIFRSKPVRQVKVKHI